MKKKILVCGLGKMGRGVYLQTLINLGISEEDITGVDIDTDMVALAQRQFPKATFFVEDVIHLGDINNETRFVSPTAVHCLQQGVTIAIVATNTPSHHRVIVGLIQCGVWNIFCEKPLSMNIKAVIEIYQEMQKHLSSGPFSESLVKIYTGFLINFSDAVSMCIDRMKSENLVVTSASSLWVKNRRGDNRPTAGVTRDDLCHAREVLRYICQEGGQIEIASSAVAANVTYAPYVDDTVQLRMNGFDESFPLMPDATVTAIETLSMVHKLRYVTFSMHSSFIYDRTERYVRLMLANKEAPGIDMYEVLLEFDTQGLLGLCDKLTMVHLRAGEPESFEFVCNRIRMQVEAFLDIVNGKVVIDSRLTQFSGAMNAVAFTEAVFKSSAANGLPIAVE